MSRLAINGGPKIRTNPFPMQVAIGEEEKKAVLRVMDTRILSHYRGAWTKYFYGGPEIKALEEEFADMMGVKYAIACNSCTSALIIACGAVGLRAGDECIVTPWSMTCSATAPMHWNATPVFADIEYENYCLNVESIKEKITDRTKAIIMVDLFGQPGDYEALRKITDEKGIYIIEDAAQAPGATLNGIKTGALGDIGCFSFTTGKHMTSGEGGMMTTNDEELAMRCRLIMNHAESVVNDMNQEKSIFYYDDLVGMNLRMTELQAAIIREQLKKLKGFIKTRQDNVEKLNFYLDGLHCIKSTHERPGAEHSYYVHPFHYLSHDILHRDKYINAVIAELTGEEGRADRPMFGKGYIKPIYKMPLFKTIEGFNEETFCLNAERLYSKEFFLSMYHNLPLNDDDIQDVADAFFKVWENREELR